MYIRCEMYLLRELLLLLQSLSLFLLGFLGVPDSQVSSAATTWGISSTRRFCSSATARVCSRNCNATAIFPLAIIFPWRWTLYNILASRRFCLGKNIWDWRTDPISNPVFTVDWIDSLNCQTSASELQEEKLARHCSYSLLQSRITADLESLKERMN